nr:zinc finger BED domain-containing protein RICESLEEPER 2-like [Ipomoea batatas]
MTNWQSTSIRPIGTLLVYDHWQSAEPRLRRSLFPPLHAKTRRRPDRDANRRDLQSRRRPPAADGFFRGKTSTRRAGEGSGAKFRQKFRVAGSSVAVTSGGSRSSATAFWCFSRLPYSSSDLPASCSNFQCPSASLFLQRCYPPFLHFFRRLQQQVRLLVLRFFRAVRHYSSLEINCVDLNEVNDGGVNVDNLDVNGDGEQNDNVDVGDEKDDDEKECENNDNQDQFQRKKRKRNAKSKFETPPLSDGKYDHMKQREAIAHWILMHEQPLNVVENYGFTFMFKVNLPQFEKVSRAIAKNDVITVYDIEKKKLQLMLRTINKISLTTNIWKSKVQKVSYMCVTGHFVDSNWQLQKRVLSFMPLPPPGVDIIDGVMKSKKDWGIEHKIFTISVDNASNNDVAV